MWHENSNSLFASCCVIHEERLGECSEDDFQRVRIAEEEKENEVVDKSEGKKKKTKGKNSKEEGVAAAHGRQKRTRGRELKRVAIEEEEEEREEEETKDEENVIWWPRRAKHDCFHFRVPFSCNTSTILRYHFSDSAKKQVPDNETPSCRGYDHY